MATELLEQFAAKYIWWKTPQAALRYPDRILAQVMELGTLEDMQNLLETSDVTALRNIMENAEVGWFSPRSWHFWHYRLGMCEVDRVPPLPQKKFA